LLRQMDQSSVVFRMAIGAQQNTLIQFFLQGLEGSRMIAPDRILLAAGIGVVKLQRCHTSVITTDRAASAFVLYGPLLDFHPVFVNRAVIAGRPAMAFIAVIDKRLAADSADTLLAKAHLG